MPRTRSSREAAAAVGVPLSSPRRTPAPRRFSEATRGLIYNRDERCCVRCGVNIASCPWSGSVQHRAGRGMGGSTVPWRQRAANGCLLCGSGTTGCHGWVEGHFDDAVRYGWAIERGIVVATAWPVLYAAAGQVRLLDDHGTYRVLAELEDDELAAALADPAFTVGVFVTS